MLIRLRIRNFKRFDDVDIELGKSVVLIGPNNSGKTTALQALALWELGLRRWNELARHIRALFGVKLSPPRYIAERSEIVMTYEDERQHTLDLSSAGRGLQQTLRSTVRKVRRDQPAAEGA